MIIEDAASSVREASEGGVLINCQDVYRWKDPFYVAVCKLSTPLRGNEVIQITDEQGRRAWGFSKTHEDSLHEILIYPVHKAPTPGSWISVSLWEATSHLREFIAVQNIPTSPLMEFLLGKKKKKTKREKVPTWTDEVDVDQCLNSSQKQAVLTAIRRENGVTLIQGPPGTGKTRTIVAILRALMTSKEERRKGVLVCAPSNVAVDELTLRLLGLSDCKVVRITAQGRGDCCIKVHLDRLSQEATATGRQEVNRMKKDLFDSGAEDAALQGYHSYQLDHLLNRRDALHRIQERIQLEHQDTILKSADIVLCTLSMAASFSILRAQAQFATVIIDEAAQAVEPSVLIPLNYNATRLILVGDPCQLPATVQSLHALSCGYARSAFERLRMVGFPVHLLDTQYRMHPEIRAFPARYFYEDRIKDGDTKQEAAFHANWYQSPYLFFDLPESSETTLGTSLFNDAEARLAALILGGLKEEESQKTVILTPYRAQADRIRHECRHPVEVSTIDGFQGMETDVVIFSCVRTRPEDQKTSTTTIGFLSDRRRLNVALTRAKKAMWIIGNADALRTHPDWAELISDAIERDVLVHVTPSSGDSFTATRHHDERHVFT